MRFASFLLPVGAFLRFFYASLCRLLPPNHRLLPPNHRLLPPNHRLLPPNHRLLPPNHRLLPPNESRLLSAIEKVAIKQ